jgi:hypothetical protein
MRLSRPRGRRSLGKFMGDTPDGELNQLLEFRIANFFDAGKVDRGR